MTEKVLLVDGLNQLIRAWAVVPLMDSNGEPVGGLVGFLRTLKLCIRETHPSQVIVAWDGAGGSARRRQLYSDYKAGRKPKLNRAYDNERPQESYDNLRAQHARLRSLLDALGVVQIEVEGTEADDVLAYLCRGPLLSFDKVVVSGDKDLLQLVDVRTLVYQPAKKKYYGVSQMLEEHGCLPENWVFVKALMGDGSDNIKGIKGVGEKTALKLFPFLSERPAILDDLFKHSEEHRSETPKYEAVLAHREVLTANVRLMELAVTTIANEAVRSIEHQLVQPRRFSVSEVKMVFLRDGIQLTDSDFFSTFTEYRARAQREDTDA